VNIQKKRELRGKLLRCTFNFKKKMNEGKVYAELEAFKTTISLLA
jgi:hypothetical protein